ncbi:SCO4983 family protein [Peterkaempfera griseoplana]|uniref:SCO4983 family protein n=1 Tax=Peterkaempfera griseoplana TaxID=66896 RepID=UPI0006E26D22|nr:hypothetical protein [Peterkaempfera griseoplana]
MYEPIRHKSVHTLREPATAAAAAPHPARHNSSEHTPPGPDRPAHLRDQLAGHLTALLTATTELRRATAAALEADGSDQALAAQQTDLVAAVRHITERIGDLSPTGARLRLRHRPGAAAGGTLAELHAHAHTLAGRVLVVAAAQQDTATAMLACRRMDAHDAARRALRAG